MTLRKLMLSTVAATAASVPMLATADSDAGFGAGATAQANLDFEITIPSFIFFQLGSAGSTIDTVAFDLQAAGEPPGSTNGVAASSTVSVILRTNASGDVQIDATGGDMDDGAGNLIPLTDITPSAATGDIPVPDFGGNTGGFVPSGLDLTDTWSFSYDNLSVLPAGTYGGAANGGRVTYTVTDI